MPSRTTLLGLLLPAGETTIQGLLRTLSSGLAIPLVEANDELLRAIRVRTGPIAQPVDSALVVFREFPILKSGSRPDSGQIFDSVIDPRARVLRNNPFRHHPGFLGTDGNGDEHERVVGE